MNRPPENPLSKPDLFRRITHEPRHYLTKILLEENEANGIEWETPEYAEIERTAPQFSLMSKDEADALLSEEGAIWFICQATGLHRFEASRLVAAGMPWPLRCLEHEKAWASGPLDAEKFEFLNRLFQPTKRLEVILSELSVNYWQAPNEPDGGPVKQAREYWKHVAGEATSDIRIVKNVALALQLYHLSIQNFIRQQNSR